MPVGTSFFYSYDSQMASKRNWFNEFIRTITVYSDGIYTNEFYCYIGKLSSVSYDI